MTSGAEWAQVEQPLLDQLASLGWQVLVWGDRGPGDRVDRLSDRDVLLERRLRDALRAINPGPDGQPWLDDVRLDTVIAELRAMPAGTKLLEANLRCTNLLLRGTTVAGLDGWDGGRDQAIRFIDYDSPTGNDLLAVSQYRVATPGRGPDIRPDLTLFVNGIPLVVIEAKPPGPASGITDAIEQLRRYANQRGAVPAEGSEQLFWTNQLTIATTGDRAEVGTFGAHAEHYMAWKDPHPTVLADTATPQQTLVAGVFAPDQLLDVVRHFVVFDSDEDGRTVKKVARYQQRRAVLKAIDRIAAGRRPRDRDGIVWHTQGSGKSLTMVFLIRAMRSHPTLRRFKVVLVTDRTSLERQLRRTAAVTGETVEVARSSAQVRTLLSRPGKGLVMAMIQKYRDPDAPQNDLGLATAASFGTLNDAEEILVMVDEAHRSHASTLHANLMDALPNATRIGFTGTPIIMGQRRKTLEIFGRYVDTYTLAESEADGSTVPIFYEGRTTDAAVAGASRLDEVFFRWFDELTDDQRETLQHKYATVAQILEAPELIRAKAEDLLRHYVATVMPDGFKGLVVATSRRACVRYIEALDLARDAIVAEVESRIHAVRAKADAGEELWDDDRFVLDAAPRLDRIRSLVFAAVISGDHNDPPDHQPWTDPAAQEERIARFTKALGPADDRHDPLALLVVKSMLLTGFDAPRTQVLYLDRLIQEAELLQAIARVNRRAGPHKHHGLVVDYYGVAAHLADALAAYTASGTVDPDVDGAMRELATEIAKLSPRRDRVRQVFVRHGHTPAATPLSLEQCVQLLEDERLRAEFDVALAEFLQTVDVVLPRPAALPYVDDATLFAEIQIRVRRRYRDTPDGDFDPRKYAEKVRSLIDRHMTVLDLTQRIPPVRITDPAFQTHVDRTPTDRAKASEMEHALRHHLRERIDTDPVRYTRISERLDELLERLGDRWDQLVIELDALLANALAHGGAAGDPSVLDPVLEGPLHRLLVQYAPIRLDAEALVHTTRDLALRIHDHSAVVGFWDNAVKQDDLRRELKRALDHTEQFDYETLDDLAVRVVDLARANRHASSRP